MYCVQRSISTVSLCCLLRHFSWCRYRLSQGSITITSGFLLATHTHTLVNLEQGDSFLCLIFIVQRVSKFRPNSSSNCCPWQVHCRLCACVSCMCLCSKCRHLFTSLAVKLFCFFVRKPKNREVSQVILCSRMRWGLLSGKSIQNMLLVKSVASSELRLVLVYVVNISEAAFKCSLTQVVTENV